MPAECSGLTASELRCMELKKRNLIFYWDDCKKKKRNELEILNANGIAKTEIYKWST